MVRTGSQFGPNWLEKWSELARLVVRTGSQNLQNGGGATWLAISRFSKVAYLSRARAKEPVQTTKCGPNWLEPEELGSRSRRPGAPMQLPSRRGGCASSRLDHGLKVELFPATPGEKNTVLGTLI